ncbi:5312_t:CDS:1, partial [Cetraspora pellucida]
MEPYRMMEDDFDDYLNDFNYEVAESSGTSIETFSSTTIKPNIQTSSNFSSLESKNKSNKISIRNPKIAKQFILIIFVLVKKTENKRLYKCKNLSFTRDYFEKKVINDE